MRKRRTRQHIIADLSANHLERYVLRCGFAVDKIQHDYGLDVIMYTYQINGEIQEAFVNIQLKASDNVKYAKRGSFISMHVSRPHLESWLAEPMPVVLVIYDAKIDKAYWVYVQRYFAHVAKRFLEVKKGYTIRVPTQQVVDEGAIYKFGEFKQATLNQLDGVISHA